jgi:hypothetical protein
MIGDEKLGTRVHGLIFFFFVSLFIELSSIIKACSFHNQRMTG